MQGLMVLLPSGPERSFCGRGQSTPGLRASCFASHEDFTSLEEVQLAPRGGASGPVPAVGVPLLASFQAGS